MGRRIWTLVVKDVRTGLRDSVVTYMLLGPVLIALLFRGVLSLWAAPPVTLVVTEDLDASLREALTAVAEVEVAPDEAAALERVRRVDDVPAVLPGPAGRPRVVLQGNEAAWVQELPRHLTDLEAWRARGGTLPQLRTDNLGEPAPRTTNIAAALLAFCILLIGGLSTGFLILEEKETQTSRVIAVAPLRFVDYLASKLGVAALVGMVLAPLSLALLLGTSELPWGPLAVALVASLPISLSLGLFVGSWANDQLGAVTLLKGALFFYTSLPVAGFFDLGAANAVLWVFPNHWAVQALYGALTGGDWAGPAALAFVTGSAVLGVVVVGMRRRLGLMPVTA